MEINGIPYKKTEISRAYLDGLLSNRSTASFEFRMNGIASVFESLSLPMIKGYLPIKNSGASINARIESVVIEKLSKLPTYKQEYVRLAVKSLSKTLAQAPSNTITLISTVVNNILQRPDYQLILEHMNTASKQDMSNIADALMSLVFQKSPTWQNKPNRAQIFLTTLSCYQKKLTPLK